MTLFGPRAFRIGVHKFLGLLLPSQEIAIIDPPIPATLELLEKHEHVLHV